MLASWAVYPYVLCMKDKRIDFLVSAEERAQMSAAADSQSLTLSAWLRMVALMAAKIALRQQEK
jgi:uncharacterized protein (DUF1778 family)